MMKPPDCVVTSDGNLILTFSETTCALFKYEDQSFHAMGPPFHPLFEVAGYPAHASIDKSFNLGVHFPHVESNSQSTSQCGLELKELCKSEHGHPCKYTLRVSDQQDLQEGESHEHKYERHLWHSHCFAYQGKLYALVMESEEMQCMKEVAWRYEHKFKRHGMSKGDIGTLLGNEDAEFHCDQFLLENLPHKLILYSAHIDTMNWTMQVCKEADASAFLDYLGNKSDIAGKLLLG